LTKVGVCGKIAQSWLSAFVATKKCNELFNSSVQIGVDQPNHIAFEQQKQYRTGNLNRHKNYNDCGTKQSETKRVGDQPFALRKYPCPRRVAITLDPILRRKRPSNASSTFASLSWSCP